MKLSIIVPVYNEEKTVIQMLDKLVAIRIPGVEKEIIVVDDGSTDASALKLKTQNVKLKTFTVITHTKNQGKGAAVRTGMKHATGEYLIIQDADLEYDPKYIAKLVKPIIQGKATVVYGTRLKRLPNFMKDESHPLFILHYFGNKLLSLITSMLYLQWITDMETCYKLFPKHAIEGMNLRARSFDFEPEITAKLLKRGYKIVELPISTVPRGYDEGKKINAIHDGRIALWTLIKYRFVE